MVLSPSGPGDGADRHGGVGLPVAVALALVLAALELVDRELLAAALLDDLTGDAGAVDDRATDGHAVVARHEEHLVEGDGVARAAGQLLDDDGIPGLHPVLLSTS